MFCSGLCGSLTPIIAEVAGISCISPRAPLEETAAWSKPDSTKMTALISDSGQAVTLGGRLD